MPSSGRSSSSGSGSNTLHSTEGEESACCTRFSTGWRRLRTAIGCAGQRRVRTALRPGRVTARCVTDKRATAPNQGSANHGRRHQHYPETARTIAASGRRVSTEARHSTGAKEALHGQPCSISDRRGAPDLGPVDVPWGLAFVLLLLVSAGMVTVPGESNGVAFVRAFYEDNRSVIVVSQVIGLAAAIAFVPSRVGCKQGVGRARPLGVRQRVRGHPLPPFSRGCPRCCCAVSPAQERLTRSPRWPPPRTGWRPARRSCRGSLSRATARRRPPRENGGKRAPADEHRGGAPDPLPVLQPTREGKKGDRCVRARAPHFRPRLPAAPLRERTGAVSTRPSPKVRVLVVDDSAVEPSRHHDAGFRPRERWRSSLAPRTARKPCAWGLKDEPVVTTLDLEMPKVDGWAS